MPWVEILVVAHVVGAAIGVGAATASDSVFLRALRNRRISSDQYLMITSVSDVVLLGLAAVTLTGSGLVWFNPELIGEAGFQAKMIVVGVLLLNGIVFHVAVIPFLETHRDRHLGEEELSPSRRALLASSGTLSAVSWYGALVLGAMPDVNWPLIAFLGIYGVLLAGGAVVAFFVLRHITPEPGEHDELRAEHEREHGSTSWERYLVGGLLAVFIGSMALAFFRANGEALTALL
jgi:MFS family permease